MTWTWDGDYERAFHKTDDPRVLAVIERDREPSAPDGDAFAPAAYVEYGYSWSFRRAGSTFDDDEAFEAYVRALNHFGSSDPRVERYLRIFHDVREVQTVRSSVHRDYEVTILDTPAYRKHVGIEPDIENILTGDVETWRAYLDGDVYGVGYAVNTTHVLDEDEDDLDLVDWTWEIQCWGFYGEKYAEEEALAFSYGGPDLPDLLPIDEMKEA